MSTHTQLGKMLFYGASGHGKVVIESWLAGNGSVAGIFDDDVNRREILNYKVYGKYTADHCAQETLLISIGSNSTRKQVASSIKHRFGNVIHPASLLSESVNLGLGTTIMAGAVVNAEVVIGNHAIINTGSIIDHDCVIGNFVHLAPGSTLCGNVIIGEGTLIGAGATIIPGIKIGAWVTVGAGAVVTKDIPDNAVVVGVPGRIRN